MNRTNRLLQLGIVFGLFGLIACAGQESPPIAFRQVKATDGLESELGLKPAAIAPTLLEKVVKSGVPLTAATVAFAKYDQFNSRISKSIPWMALIDFTKRSGVPRFYMINTVTGEVDPWLVAHGLGSDPNNTGTPVRFSNTPNSKMTSLGAYIVAEKFHSAKHQTAARLDGLEASNSFARPRAIILHSAKYVTTARTKMGMSWGCPAIPLDKIATALKRLSGGGFMYAFGNAPEPKVVDDLLLESFFDPTYPWVNESEDAPVDGEGG